MGVEMVINMTHITINTPSMREEERQKSWEGNILPKLYIQRDSLRDSEIKNLIL